MRTIELIKKSTCAVVLFLLIGCGGTTDSAENDTPTIEISEADIDAYVAVKLDASQEYSVAQSLRFSKENETYEAVQYLQGDTLVLYLETEQLTGKSISRNTFYKDGVPVYIDEYFSINTVDSEPFIQRKIYMDGANVMSAFERKSFTEGELELAAYNPVEVDLEYYDFDRPKRAVNQLDEFALQFEEFLIIDPQTYLILGNEESGYEAALFVAEEHPLLTEMNTDPTAYKGKTMHVYHQFVLTNGIERMLFIDGEIVADSLAN